MIKRNMLGILAEAVKAENLYVNEYDNDEYDGFCDDVKDFDDDVKTLAREYDDEEDDVHGDYIEDDDEEDDIDVEDLRNAEDGDEHIDDEEVEEIKNDIMDVYDDMEEVDEDELGYSEEMVPVIATSESTYYVEYDNLAKLMKASRCDAATAMEKICECNNLQLEDMRLVVESAAEIIRILNEKAASKKVKKKKALAMKSSVKFLKDLKNKGITVVKKKSNKKALKAKSKKRKRK